MATQPWVEEGRVGLPPTGEPEAPPQIGRLSDVLYQFRGNPATIGGAVIVGIVVLAAIFAPEFPPYGPYKIDIENAAVGPTWSHPFGTDQFGHDILSRVLVAARLDLIIALSAVAASMTVGVVLGAVAGFLGRWLDELIMR